MVRQDADDPAGRSARSAACMSVRLRAQPGKLGVCRYCPSATARFLYGRISPATTPGSRWPARRHGRMRTASGRTPSPSAIRRLMLLAGKQSKQRSLPAVRAPRSCSSPTVFPFSSPDHPILVVDMSDTFLSVAEFPEIAGRTPFRCIPTELWSVDNNLNIANMGWEDFAGPLVTCQSRGGSGDRHSRPCRRGRRIPFNRHRVFGDSWLQWRPGSPIAPVWPMALP